MNKVKAQMKTPELNQSLTPRVLGRRAFLGRVAVGAALLAPGSALFADPKGQFKPKPRGSGISKGDAALTRAKPKGISSARGKASQPSKRARYMNWMVAVVWYKPKVPFEPMPVKFGWK